MFKSLRIRQKWLIFGQLHVIKIILRKSLWFPKIFGLICEEKKAEESPYKPQWFARIECGLANHGSPFRRRPSRGLCRNKGTEFTVDTRPLVLGFRDQQSSKKGPRFLFPALCQMAFRGDCCSKDPSSGLRFGDQKKALDFFFRWIKKLPYQVGEFHWRKSTNLLEIKLFFLALSHFGRKSKNLLEVKLPRMKWKYFFISSRRFADFWKISMT